MSEDEIVVPVQKLRRAKVVYHRVILQEVEKDTFKLIEDLGPTTTAKAISKAKKLTKSGQTGLSVVYWVS